MQFFEQRMATPLDFLAGTESRASVQLAGMHVRSVMHELANYRTELRIFYSSIYFNSSCRLVAELPNGRTLTARDAAFVKDQSGYSKYNQHVVYYIRIWT